MADERGRLWRKNGELVRFGTIVAAASLLIAFLVTTAIMTSTNVSETTDLVYELKGEYLESNVDQLINGMETYRAERLRELAANRGVAEEDLSEADVAAVDEEVQQYAKDVIYGADFGDGSYIWVNQVLDYDGGDDYAIRIIHPNLPETVGMRLSTNTMDVAGNHPYREELEGVLAHPEGFFYTYYFKELDSDVISEKYAYAKLYDRYDWIIAMGVYVNEIDEYADQARGVGSRVGLVGTLVLLGVLGTFAAGVYFVSKRRLQDAYDTANAKLRHEAHVDALTGCWNRGYGDRLLAEAFSDFRRNDVGCGVLMVDIDRFKDVNDTYGHDAGDRALRAVADALRGSFRAVDQVVRWGGDEFVVVLHGFTTEGVDAVEAKLREATARSRIEVDGKAIAMTLSAGLAAFGPEDKGYKPAVARADEALYEAKDGGRDRLCRRL